MFLDWPFLSVYSDDSKLPYIFNWVDCEGEINRFLIFRTSINNLIGYVTGEISQFDLLNSPEGNQFIVVDYDVDMNPHEHHIISKDLLPAVYWPEKNTFHEEDLSDDISNIFSHFDLSGKAYISPGEDESFDLKEFTLSESEQLNGETVNIHIAGSNVPEGEINAGILGRMLYGYQELNTEMAISLFRLNNPRRRLTQTVKNRILQESSLDYYSQKAASFVAMMKPHVKRFSADGGSMVEEVNKKLFELFQISDNPEQLLEQKVIYGDRLIKIFKRLLEDVKLKDIELEIGWGNFEKSEFIAHSFTPQRAEQIIAVIDTISIGEVKTISVSGKFLALDRESNSFKFLSESGEKYRGHFSDQLRDGTMHRNLEDSYQVSLKIQEKIKVGSVRQPQVDIKMVSCIKS